MQFNVGHLHIYVGNIWLIIRSIRHLSHTLQVYKSHTILALSLKHKYIKDNPQHTERNTTKAGLHLCVFKSILDHEEE